MRTESSSQNRHASKQEAPARSQPPTMPFEQERCKAKSIVKVRGEGEADDVIVYVCN